MKKHLILLILFAFTCSIQAQVVRGLRIGYIDMEYILQNVPDFTEANNQLEQKAQKWKQEISAKNNDITKLKESLKTERVLLTKELIEEREEEIAFQEKELMDYQEKRFGPNGDLMVQKAVLVKPTQDQVFTAVQDIAEQKRYDFVFDKSSDLTMIFAAKQFDISEIIIRQLTRISKRSQLSKSELKEQAKKEYQEDVQDANSDYAIRKKMLDDKKAARDSINDARKVAREKIIADRKAAADAKREAAAAKRQAIIDKRNGVTPSSPATKPEDATSPEKETDPKPTTK
ncbi:OmpH family outer membrane protein [Flavobacterium sp. SM2513]|uniref:OmpH family outer membrane protein n=1 Tax=Flavobacterium sp. SM2513 TaxID=3424766 RepID=UPI003D7F6433